MATTADLIEALSSALGVPQSEATIHVRRLREARLLPATKGGRGAAGGASVNAEHAAVLLISLMSGVPATKAAETVTLYAGLPLEVVSRGELLPDGRFESFSIAEADPVMADIDTFGDTFGEFLAGLIEAYATAPETSIEPTMVMLGGGLGTASASVHLNALADARTVGAVVTFGMAPLGGGQRPDDAPRARLERHSCVPGTVFQVFRELFSGQAEGPRQRTAEQLAEHTAYGEMA